MSFEARQTMEAYTGTMHFWRKRTMKKLLK